MFYGQRAVISVTEVYSAILIEFVWNNRINIASKKGKYTELQKL
jgi:hypothetical protein